MKTLHELVGMPLVTVQEGTRQDAIRAFGRDASIVADEVAVRGEAPPGTPHQPPGS